MTWGFYGRQAELKQLTEILGRGRWFFVKITGRRRIGKTTLIQQALPASGRQVFYVQIPDSGPAGVLSAVTDAMETFQIDRTTFPPPTSLNALARTIGNLARAGYVIALDEFQYFNRERLSDLVALDETGRRIRFASCKRNGERLPADVVAFDGHVQRFLAANPQFASWTIEKVGIAPVITPDVRARLHAAGHLAQDLAELIAELA